MLDHQRLAQTEVDRVTCHKNKTPDAAGCVEKNMNTMFLLMAEYETATVPLSQVCEKYFGMKSATAERKASENKLPVPTFRTAESQKAPRMVHIADLADYIDEQRKASRELHSATHTRQ